ncbi:MAG TPA: hypothetical protein VFA60_04895 [Terriglobales bacterium]|nr:hypothetical protein [Terriglobales bacterium]
MKSWIGLKILVFAVVLFTAAGAFAAGKGSVTLTKPTLVGGEQLPAGVYKLQWEGNGPAVELKVLRGNKVVATVPAEVVEHDTAEADSAIVVNDTGSGRTLSEVRFGGKKYSLAVGSPSAQKSIGMGKREAGN